MQDNQTSQRAAWFWPALIVAYFTAQLIARTALGGTLGLDDAEMMLDAQSYRMGYGPQLPLYGWLQRTVFLITGPTIFGLSLLKNIVLCTLVLSLYAMVRTRFDPQTAFLASVSLILVPQISWESQRALTHSSAVTCLAVVFIAYIWSTPKLAPKLRFALLGLLMAAGFLAKYNFAVPFLAAMMAAATIPRLRAALMRPGLAVSFIIAAALLYFPIAWVIENPAVAFGSAHKLKVAEDGPTAGHALSGTVAFVMAFINYSILPVIVIAGLWLFGRKKGYSREPVGDLERYLWRVAVISIVVVAIGISFSGVTAVKDRWLQPVLIIAVPTAILWLLPYLSDAGRRWLGRIYLFLAVLIFLLLPYHFNEPGTRMASRFDLAIPQIQQSLGEDVVLLAPQWEAGNILGLAPSNPVVEIGGLPEIPRGRDMALVWRDKGIEQGPILIERLQDRLPGARLGEVQTIRIPHRFGGKNDYFLLYFAPIIVPGGHD